jgi:CO/xanthine dehydrogenase Mo-binding subunit
MGQPRDFAAFGAAEASGATAVDGRVGRFPGRIGDSPTRPDGTAKVQGTFAFSSDMRVDGMLHGATLRSPHPSARILEIDATEALAMAGVECVLTKDDVPGELHYGLIDQDQPVFADGVVRYQGEPVAAVAAEHPETARRALAAIKVTYEVMAPIVDPELIIAGDCPEIHPRGNVFRHQEVVAGDPDAVGEIQVEGIYEIGMQDQAFLGLESALGIPDHDGSGIDLVVATQWLHEDRKQLAHCLGDARGQGASYLGWSRRRIWWKRRHQSSGSHSASCAEDWQASADAVLAGRVVLRSCASTPCEDLDATSRRPIWRPRQG